MIAVAEALVVHGHGLTREGETDPTTAMRVDTAVSAWRAGVAPVLALSGGHSFLLSAPPAISEAAAMKSYAVRKGVPEASIAVEDKSLDTVGNALFTKTELALPKDWEHLAVVTSESHLPRLLKVYRHVFGNEFEIQGIAAPQSIGLREKIWEPLGSALVREVLRGTKAGDHEAIRGRLFDLVPGYADGTLHWLAIRSLTGLLKSR